mgnify:CR=1 FL=1
MTQAEWFFLACAIVGGVVFLLRPVLMFAGAGDLSSPGSMRNAKGISTDHASDDSFRITSGIRAARMGQRLLIFFRA